MSEKLAYSVAELCAAANFGRTTAFAAIRSGALRAVKVGSRTLILAEDLRKYLSSLPAANPHPKSRK